MATPSVSSLALFAPVVASNAVFSARRASRGVDAMDENPVLGTMNMTIAGAQVLKGVTAAADAACLSSPEMQSTVQSATESIKKLSEKSKIVKGGSKALQFVADNINPLICVAGGVKVLGSEDKLDAGVREGLALTTMFIAEDAYKYITGMPIKSNGQMKKVAGAYKKCSPFLAKQVEAFKQTCETKKLFNTLSLKSLPGILQGLGFAVASIMGYKLGSTIANKVLGKSKEEAEKDANK